MALRALRGVATLSEVCARASRCQLTTQLQRCTSTGVSACPLNYTTMLPTMWSRVQQVAPVQARGCASSATENVDAGSEPVDWTTILPDNLHLHNPQDAMPEATMPYATEDERALPVLGFAAGEDVQGNGEEVVLDNRVFGVEIRSDIVHRVVQWQLANRRTKVYKTKTISEVRGGGRKPWQQKHTGRARAGSIRSAHWRGGAKAHGPKIRDWSQKLNKKIRRMGLRIALASKYHDRRLMVVDKFAADSGKTRDVVALLKEHGLDKQRVLLMDAPEFDPVFLQAAWNVKRLHSLPTQGANVFSILKSDVLVVTPRALESLYERLIDDYVPNEDA